MEHTNPHVKNFFSQLKVVAIYVVGVAVKHQPRGKVWRQKKWELCREEEVWGKEEGAWGKEEGVWWKEEGEGKSRR